MADLTAPIDAEKPELFVPHGPKEPIDRSGGLLEGLVNAGTQTVGMLGRLGEQSDRNNMNAYAAGAFNTLAKDDQALSPQAQAFATNGVNTLNKAQKAEDQGSMPAGTVGLHLQNFTSQALAQHPNDAVKILQFAKEQGYDSIMFQNVYNQQAADKAMAEAKTSEKVDNYKAGAPYAMPDWSDDQISAYGQKVRLASAQLQAAKEQAEANKDIAAANKDNYSTQKSVDDDKLRGALNDQWVLHSTPVLDHFHQMVASDPDDLAKHPEYLTGAVNFFEAQRAQLHAAGRGLDPAVMESLDKQINDTEKGFRDFYTDYSKGKELVLNNMKTTFGLEGVEAFPVYSQMKSILGESYLNQVFGGMGPTLPKPMLDAMRNEFSGYASMDSSQGIMAVNAVGAMLKGQLKLQDVPQDQIRNVVAGAIVGVSAHTADINAGRLDPVNTTQFINSTGTLIDAAYSIQPQGNPDIKTIQTASRSLSDPRVVAAAERLSSNPATADKGQALLMGLRGANQHLLLAAKNANTQQSVSFTGQPGGSTFVERGMSQNVPAAPAYSAGLTFDPKSGYFTVNSKGNVPGFQMEPLTNQAKVMNDALNVLVSTTGQDKNFPQGATPLSLRQFYAGQGGLDTLVNAKGGKVYQPPKPEDTGDNRISKEVDTLKGLTQQTVEGTEKMQSTMKEVTKPLTDAYNPKSPTAIASTQLVTETAPKYASIAGMTELDFTDLAKALAVQESAMGSATTSPTGVKGIMQVTQKTGEGYIKGFDRNNQQQDVDAGSHYLADLIKQHKGNLAAALHEYNGGGDPLYASKILNYYHQFQQERQGTMLASAT